MSGMAELVRTVYQKSGVDFSCYRAPTIERRVHNRMMSLGMKDLETYRALLQESEDEARQLIERITIKVSRFWRNPEVFETLRRVVLPGAPLAGRDLHVWSAGCGRGEEAYSLAMLLEEADVAGRVTATDIDECALGEAAAGRYPAEAASELPQRLRDRFLQPIGQRAGGRLAVCTPVRSRVTFRHEDLTAPHARSPERFDLVCCRNVLIYWNAGTQRHILNGLLARLRPGGVLCLGEAEWPPAGIGAPLQPLNARLRIFRMSGARGTP